MEYIETQTLIVVYKDEILVNQLKKLVESKDSTIQIAAWPEKLWLQQKKTGTIDNKILYIGDIKGTDKLLPVLDVYFSEHGVMFGWAGNQAMLAVDPTKIKSSEEYAIFLSALEKLPVPRFVKEAAKSTTVHKITAKNSEGKVDIKEMLSSIGAKINDTTKDVFYDRKALKQQMLFYGIINICNNHLVRFMNS